MEPQAVQTEGSVLLFPHVVNLKILKRLNDPKDKLKVLEALPVVGPLLHWTKEDLEFEHELLTNLLEGSINWSLGDTIYLSTNCRLSQYRSKLIKLLYETHLIERFYTLETSVDLETDGVDPAHLWLIDGPKIHTLNYGCDGGVPLFVGLCIPIDDTSEKQNRLAEKYSCAVWNCSLAIQQTTVTCMVKIQGYLNIFQNLRCLTIHFNPNQNVNQEHDLRLNEIMLPHMNYLKSIKFQGRLIASGAYQNKLLIEKLLVTYGNSLKSLGWDVLLESNGPLTYMSSVKFNWCTSVRLFHIISYNTLEAANAILSQLKHVPLTSISIAGASIFQNLTSAFYETLNLANRNWNGSLELLKIKLEPSIDIGPDGLLGPHFMFQESSFLRCTSVSLEFPVDLFQIDERMDMDWDFLLLFPNIKDLTVIADFRCFRTCNLLLPPNKDVLRLSNIWSLLPKLHTVYFESEEDYGRVNRDGV